MRNSVKKGGAIEFGAGLSNMPKLKTPHMPSTGMKYSKNRVQNVGAQMNHLIHLQQPRIKKFAGGGCVDRDVSNARQVLSGIALKKADGGKVDTVAKLLHYIEDRVTGVRVSGAYQSKTLARNRLDKLDNDYGSYRHRIVSEPAPPNTPRGSKTTEADDIPSAFAGGGKVVIGEAALRAITDALDHLANRDAASAAGTLRSSKEALREPDIAAAAGSLRSSAGIKPAASALHRVMERNTNATRMEGLADGGAISICPHCGENLS